MEQERSSAKSLQDPKRSDAEGQWLWRRGGTIHY